MLKNTYEDVIEEKPNELPFVFNFRQREIEGKICMKVDDKRHVFYYETKLTKGLIRGKVDMNIKGFYRQTKEFKIETTKKPKITSNDERL